MKSVSLLVFCFAYCLLSFGQDKVILYKDFYFKGTSKELKPIGKYNLAQEGFDNIASSIYIPSGYFVKISNSDDVDQGYFLRESLKSFNLIDLNDKASSIEVVGPYVTLYKESYESGKKKFPKGDALSLPVGDHVMTELCETFRSRIRYISIPEGYTVKIRQEGQTEAKEFNSDITETQLSYAAISNIESVSFFKTGSQETNSGIAMRPNDSNPLKDIAAKAPDVENKLILTQAAINSFINIDTAAKVLRFVANTIEIADSIVIDRQLEFYANHFYMLDASSIAARYDTPAYDSISISGKPANNVYIYSAKTGVGKVDLVGGDGGGYPARKAPYYFDFISSSWALSQIKQASGSIGGTGGNLYVTTINPSAIDESRSRVIVDVQRSSTEPDKRTQPVPTPNDLPKLKKPKINYNLSGGNGGDGAPETYVLYKEPLIFQITNKYIGLESGKIAFNNQKLNTQATHFIKGSIPRGEKGPEGMKDDFYEFTVSKSVFDSLMSEKLEGLVWSEVVNKNWQFIPVSELPDVNDAAVIFEDAQYSGRHRLLKIGRYRFQSPLDFNDVISSVKLPIGYRVIAFVDANDQGGTGESIIIDQNSPDLALLNFNDKISFIEIVKVNGSHLVPQGN